MQRILEPELMDDLEQAKAYANADFENSNTLFVHLFAEKFPESGDQGYTVDLGCGPGDIMIRLAQVYRGMILHGVDGSSSMIRLAENAAKKNPLLGERIFFFNQVLPSVKLPIAQYDSVISNSLLHHLPDPAIFWQIVKELAKPGTGIFVMDLFRPDSKEQAQALVEKYSANEPEVLKKDFFNSLCAAFTLKEIKHQLKAAKLTYLEIEEVSDRHLGVYGNFKG